jgi:tape measure domain-containing protein
MSNIRVELQLADGSFTSGMLRAGQSLNEFNQQLIRTNPRLAALAAGSGSIVTSINRADGATKGFLGTLRDVSIVTGLVSMGLSTMSGVANGFVGEIVKVNAEMERLRFMMQAMSTAKDPFADANRSVAYLRDQAKNMPFAMGTITNAFVKLKTTGMDPMNGSLTALADGISAFGGDDQAFNRVTVAITQMAGKSVIQMEELRQQLGEQMPAAFQVMARSAGVSVAELTKAISTGRVEAKPALEGFFQELERSYGGEAQRMMQTFSGQVSQLATNLQNLATNEGGRGFFDQVKAQLVDINQFLSSNAAQMFATRLGQGLSQAVGWIRTAAENVFEFRNEILNVGSAIAAAFGGLAIIRGIGSFVSAVGSLRAALVGVGAQFQVAGNAQAYYNLVTNSGAPALVRLRAAMLVTTEAAAGLTMTLTAVAPWVAAVGIAVYTAGNYFGWFTDKVKENYETLEQYGAQTRKQAADTIAARKAELEANLEVFEAQKKQQEDLAKWGVTTADSTDVEENIKKAKAALDDLNKKQEDILNQAASNEDQSELAKLDRRLQTEIGMIENNYRQQQEKAEVHYNELAKQDADAGKVAVKTEQDRKAAILAIQQERSKAILDIYQKEEDELKKRQQTALGDELTRINTLLGNVRARWLQENDNLKNLKMPAGIQFANKPINDAQNIKQGQTTLKSLTDDIAKVQAQLGGASGAAAEMWQKIKNGDYGQIEGATEETKKLHEELMAATTQKEALDKLMAGQKKAEQDLASVKEKVLAKEFELRKKMSGGDNMTDSEEFLLKLQDGFYQGLGPIDNIREAISGVTSALDLTGTTLNTIGNVTRNNTFGDQTAQKIQTVTDKLREMSGVLADISRGVSGIDMSNIGKGLPTSTAGFSGGALMGMAGFSGVPTSGANLMSKHMDIFGDPRTPGWAAQNLTDVGIDNGMKVQVNKLAADAFKGFLNELLGQGYNIKSLGGYALRDKVSGNGISEHAFGNAIDINPDQNPYGKGFKTDLPANIRELAAKYGLSWGGDWKSVKDTMHFEWRGGNAPQGRVPAADSAPGAGQMPQVPEIPQYDSTATQERQNQLLQDRVAMTEKLQEEGKKLAEREAAADEGMDEVKRKEALDTILKKTQELTTQTDKLGKTEERYVNAITHGELGRSKDPKAKEYQDILAAAREQDKIEGQLNDKAKAGTEAARDRKKLDEQRAELVKEIAEQEKLAKNPDYKPESSQLANTRKQLDDYVQSIKDSEGEASQAYKDAVDYRSAYLAQTQQRDLLTQRAAMNSNTRDLQTNLLSQSQIRAVSMQRELDELNRREAQELAVTGQTEAQKAQITEDYEKAKAAIRAKYNAEASPLQKQMTEWRDVQTELAQASTKWMDSLAGGITDLITGTGDLRSAIQGILKDIVNMGVKYMMGSLMQGKQGGAGRAGAKASKGGQSKIAASGKSAGLYHTGGIVGMGTGASKIASAAAWMNAPKFHTGGIVGSSLLPNEVPIIAKKGEGVFTEDQMSAMGGFSQQQNVQINAPVTVNASGGTPEQNNDLAQKMSKQMETTMRSVVADELRKQTRPGNYLNQRSR